MSAVLAILSFGAAAARAEAPLLISVAANGSGGGITLSGIATPTNPLGSVASITPDGRYVAFCSDLGLLPGTSMARQIYVRDIVASTTTLVSGNTAGTGGGSGTCVGWPLISADGRYVAFVHTAADFPTGIPDTNGTADVFLRDRVAGTTTLVSVSHDGAAAAGEVDLITMSEDGRRVAFNSRALNLVAGFVDGSPGQVDVYLRDLVAGTTELVNAAAGTSVTGGSGEAQIALGPYPMSADGRYLLFHSPAANLVAAIPGLGARNLYVRDVVNHTTTLVSASHDSAKAVGSSGRGSISADGRFVAFESADRDVVSPPSSPFGQPDVYRRDLQSQANVLASVNSSGTGAGNGNSVSPIMSRNGNMVVFMSAATDLVPGLALSFYAAVYARDLTAGTTEMIDVNAAGTGVGDQSAYPTDISPDGRYVAFHSGAKDLVTGVTYPPFGFNQFIRDRVTDTTVLASVSPAGTAAADRNASLGRITPSGAVAFASSASNLTSPPQGILTNLYVFRLSGALSITGTVTASTGGALSGVTLTLSGAQGGATTTGPGGTYAFAGLPLNGSFTVTPSRPGFAFAPPSRSFASLASSVSGADFVGTAPTGPVTYTISGRVQDRLGTGVEGTLVSLTGTQSTTQLTNAEGEFAFAALAAGGDYTVTPTKTGFAFDPVAQSFTNLQSNQTTVFFTATVGIFTRYFAEGATSDFFDTALALLNASGTPTVAHVNLQRSDGLVRTVDVPLAGIARATVDPKTLPEFANAEMATVVTSDQPVIADRTMRWDATGYGSHAETSIAAPQTVWYFAEGATIAGFNLFYLLQNPGSTAADVTVRYLLPAPAPPVVKQYTVGPQSRFNIWVNLEDPRLDDAEVSAVITVANGVAIIAERAMYLDAQGKMFGAGHESAGVPAPMTTWFLAEGATGSYFELFVLVANPGDTPAELEARYLLPTGEVITKPYTVAGNSRFNIWVDLEDARLANTPVSTSIISTNGVPIIVERAMWWPGVTGTWHEGHNSAGAIQTGTKWGLAEGELGGLTALETYILVANTSPADTQVRVTLYFEGGATAERVFPVAANSRFNVAVLTEFPDADGKRFGAIVESIGTAPAQIVVERSMYSNSGGTDWAAGTNNIATRLR